MARKRYSQWDEPPPADGQEMRRRIANYLDTAPVGGFKDVRGPDGEEVRLKVSDLYRHYWKDHPDRWLDVPLVEPFIAEASEIWGRDPRWGDKVYIGHLMVGQPGKRAHGRLYLTAVEESSPHHRVWKSSYRVQTEEEQLRHAKGAGRLLWPARSPQRANRASRPSRPPAGAGNPTSSRPTIDVSRSDARRPSGLPLDMDPVSRELGLGVPRARVASPRPTRNRSTARGRGSSQGRTVALLLGAALLLAVLLGRSTQPTFETGG